MARHVTPRHKRRSFVYFIVALIALLAIVGAAVYYFAEIRPNESIVETPTAPSSPVVPSETPTTAPEVPVGEGTPAPEGNQAPTGTGNTVAQIENILARLTIVDATSVDNNIADPSIVGNSGYERKLFGSGWLDTDDNGCDTRNDILLRDLVEVTVDSDGCKVLSGTLNDLYTGEVIDFVFGKDTSAAVQIDHLIPLSLAWALGANTWDTETRQAFANDPLNVYASKGAANNNKSDQGIGDWTPALYSCIAIDKDAGQSTKKAKELCQSIPLYDGSFYQSYDCEYAARYILVADKYKLPVTDKDVPRIEAALATCK